MGGVVVVEFTVWKRGLVCWRGLGIRGLGKQLGLDGFEILRHRSGRGFPGRRDIFF